MTTFLIENKVFIASALFLAALVAGAAQLQGIHDAPQDAHPKAPEQQVSSAPAVTVPPASQWQVVPASAPKASTATPPQPVAPPPAVTAPPVRHRVYNGDDD